MSFVHVRKGVHVTEHAQGCTRDMAALSIIFGVGTGEPTVYIYIYIYSMFYNLFPYKVGGPHPKPQSAFLKTFQKNFQPKATITP